MAGVLAAGLAFAANAEAKTLIVPPRPGQVGLGLWGQYGDLLQNGTLGEMFGNGPGLAVRLRYRMRYERAIGLSFESQNFDNRVVSAVDTVANRLTIITSGVEIYQMFGTRTAITRWLSAGVGIAQLHATLVDGDVTYPPDGFYLSGAAGFEKFFYRSLAYDLNVRYMAIFENGSTNHQFSAAAGLIFYAGY
jgi:hypothetical protein